MFPWKPFFRIAEKERYLVLGLLLGLAVGLEFGLLLSFFPGKGRDGATGPVGLSGSDWGVIPPELDGGETEAVEIYKSTEDRNTQLNCKRLPMFQKFLSRCLFENGCDSTNLIDYDRFRCRTGREYRLIWQESFNEPGFSVGLQQPPISFRKSYPFLQEKSIRRNFESAACKELEKCGFDIQRMLSSTGGFPLPVYSSGSQYDGRYPLYCFNSSKFAAVAKQEAIRSNCNAYIEQIDQEHLRVSMSCERAAEPCPKVLLGDVFISGAGPIFVYYSGYSTDRCPGGDFLGPQHRPNFGLGVPSFLDRILETCNTRH